MKALIASLVAVVGSLAASMTVAQDKPATKPPGMQIAYQFDRPVFLNKYKENKPDPSACSKFTEMVDTLMPDSALAVNDKTKPQFLAQRTRFVKWYRGGGKAEWMRAGADCVQGDLDVLESSLVNTASAHDFIWALEQLYLASGYVEDDTLDEQTETIVSHRYELPDSGIETPITLIVGDGKPRACVIRRGAIPTVICP